MIGDANALRRACQFYAEKYQYSADNLERGLEGYAAHLFAQEEGFNPVLDGKPTKEADLQERICRSDDLGIDAVLEDEMGRRIILVQAAWRRKGLQEDKVAAFFDSPAKLMSADYLAQGGEQIQELLGNFGDAVRDGWEISLRFVTNAKVGMNDRLQELVEVKNAQYEEGDQAITCELFGESELLRREAELRSALKGGIADKVELRFQDGKLIELNDPYRTVIGVVKGNELADLYRRRGVGNNLFNLNIRLPLTSRKVNPKIVDTATSSTEGRHFLYYNNGVAAVCAKYTRKGNVVEAERFQIINGAQTVSALAKAARRSPNADVYVLFRLTETAESYGGQFTENIIRFNNTQNPVKVSDFFANDAIQEWLRDNLFKVAGKGPVPNFYYVYKSGYKPKGATGKGLRIEQLAAIRHAFLHGPTAGYREPQQFFDRGGLYWAAFGSDGNETDHWTAEELAQFAAALTINERVQAVSKTLKTDPATKDLPEAKYLYRLSRYAVGLVAVGLEAIRGETFNDYRTLTASAATFDKYVEPLIKTSRRTIRSEWNHRTKSSKAVQPEYNLARDEKTWSRLSEETRQEVLSDVLPDVR
ncbi:AIPR family protein [Kribbella sp. CA-245084]|uniref:AIPR family protein n=1 Tax=Kribbella sp. CA-245084 TaxID=3239940 RepID=UPI003D92E05F